MASVKIRSGNRFLDVTLSALLNVSINGPAELENGAALANADKWLHGKGRRQATTLLLERVRSVVHHTSTINEEAVEISTKHFHLQIFFYNLLAI